MFIISKITYEMFSRSKKKNVSLYSIVAVSLSKDYKSSVQLAINEHRVDKLPSTTGKVTSKIF